MRRPKLVVALDVPDARSALQAVERLDGQADVLKVGLQLFTAAGPQLVRRLCDEGWGIFLDLKIHDIPATAAGAVAAASDLGVELLTLHASGGGDMLRAAAAGRTPGSALRLLGVTLLTSMGRDDLDAVGWSETPEQLVSRLCKLAHDSGCDGVVASVHETAAIKASCGGSFLVVTPGIRPAGAAADDQARVATPAAAARAGSDYIVVGRPILRADNPGAAARAILQELEATSDDGDDRVDRPGHD